MAGDWIKMEVSTPDKPEVLAIAARMGWDDPDLVVGKLFRVWRWFDQHTEKGNAPSVTTALIDRMCGVPGFAEAMQSVGWLHVSKTGVDLPKFDRHCGKTAKTRALGAKRVAEHKSNAKANGAGNARGNGDGNGEGNDATVSDALPREEKRRRRKPPKPPAGVDAEIPDWLPRQAWVRFVEFRASGKHPLTEHGVPLAIRALADLRDDGNDPVKVIDRTILHGWRGFYPLDQRQADRELASAVDDQFAGVR